MLELQKIDVLIQIIINGKYFWHNKEHKGHNVARHWFKW